MRAHGQSSPSPSHLPRVVSELIIAELARGHRWNRNLEPNLCPGRGLNPEPHDWLSSTLTTRLPCSPLLFSQCLMQKASTDCTTRPTKPWSFIHSFIHIEYLNSASGQVMVNIQKIHQRYDHKTKSMNRNSSFIQHSFS